jgi:ribonuclease E
MLDDEPTTSPPGTADGTTAGAAEPAAPKKATRSRKKAAAPPPDAAAEGSGAGAAASADPAPKKTAAPRKRTSKAKAAAEVETASAAGSSDGEGTTAAGAPAAVFQAPAPAPRKRAAKKTAAAAAKSPASPETPASLETPASAETSAEAGEAASPAADTQSAAEPGGEPGASEPAAPTGSRRRRGRRGRGRGGADDADAGTDSATEPSADAGSGGSGSAEETSDAEDTAEGDGEGEGGTGTRRRRRRRRRRSGEGGSGDGAADEAAGEDEGVETVVHVREPRQAQKKTAQKTTQKTAQRPGSRDDDVQGVKGSTRLEAKRQRRREGRDTGRRRPPIITEAEFLARRESVDRVMVVRQGPDRTQIGVLEDGVLVEHYVARKDHTSMVGNVYLGKVQNVLPSMEAAFVDIGRGRNAVLYAGEVNYDASAIEGRPPRIEQALKSGQSVLVQVTKDPIGHKGSRLTSQVSLPGRYMVYVPDGRLSGISRKLPDTERSRLKGILKRLTPEDAGVIIRTAAEGATEEELERDLKRLQAQWEDIDKKAQTASAPALIYGEPDVVIRVIRDIFNEDFSALVVSGDDEWDTVDNYVRWVAPDLAERARKWTEPEDVFAAYRIDEQLAKALDRKVWLPSGGYLVIDRTEAMIVVDVNTGKFTGKGGNLEETVTKNNIEAAEEIVRQLRLRDLGGIIVIDFIDMVLESNRELVLRRLMECLGRDRTRHQVAEVTSLGLVQMTRKRVGQGLLEAFSEPCKECGGRGVILTHDPVASKRPPAQKRAEVAPSADGDPAGGDAAKPKRRSRGGRGRGGSGGEGSGGEGSGGEGSGGEGSGGEGSGESQQEPVAVQA